MLLEDRGDNIVHDFFLDHVEFRRQRNIVYDVFRRLKITRDGLTDMTSHRDA